MSRPSMLEMLCRDARACPRRRPRTPSAPRRGSPPRCRRGGRRGRASNVSGLSPSASAPTRSTTISSVGSSIGARTVHHAGDRPAPTAARTSSALISHDRQILTVDPNDREVVTSRARTSSIRSWLVRDHRPWLARIAVDRAPDGSKGPVVVGGRSMFSQISPEFTWPRPVGQDRSAHMSPHRSGRLG